MKRGVQAPGDRHFSYRAKLTGRIGTLPVQIPHDVEQDLKAAMDPDSL
jgi:hypothetical protein